MGAAAADVFVLGLDPFHAAPMERVRDASRYVIRELLPADRVRPWPGFDLEAVLQSALGRLRGARGRADAVVGYWNFPTSTLLPVLRAEAGPPGPSLEAVLRGDGPCPPWNDDKPHAYTFTAYALDVERCPVEGPFAAADVVSAIEDHVLDRAALTGTYTLDPALRWAADR